MTTGMAFLHPWMVILQISILSLPPCRGTNTAARLQESTSPPRDDQLTVKLRG